MRTEQKNQKGKNPLTSFYFPLFFLLFYFIFPIWPYNSEVLFDENARLCGPSPGLLQWIGITTLLDENQFSKASCFPLSLILFFHYWTFCAQNLFSVQTFSYNKSAKFLASRTYLVHLINRAPWDSFNICNFQINIPDSAAFFINLYRSGKISLP